MLAAPLVLLAASSALLPHNALVARSVRPHSLRLASAMPRVRPLMLEEQEEERRGGVDSWGIMQKFVLLRDDMSLDELRDSTKFRTAKSWSWAERTPGTARTILLTAAAITFFALPALLMNPTVFGYLLEFAALSREGVTPGEFWGDVARDLFGRLASIGSQPAF